jgi:hypothetical protein
MQNTYSISGLRISIKRRKSSISGCKLSKIDRRIKGRSRFIGGFKGRSRGRFKGRSRGGSKGGFKGRPRGGSRSRSRDRSRCGRKDLNFIFLVRKSNLKRDAKHLQYIWIGDEHLEEEEQHI